MSGLVATGIVGGYAAADEVVRGVTLSAAAGELTCVIGPNGAGKSTALKLVAGLLRPRQGIVMLEGRDLSGLPPRAALTAGLVFVPQERNIFAALSVEENLLMGGYATGLTGGYAAGRAALDEAYANFPALRARRRTAAGSLSGGQRQVLAMASALMARPRALLLDEPTAGLSPQAAAELLALIQRLARAGLAILMVEQNATEALAASDRAAVMVDGRVVRDGPAAEVAGDPEIRRLFLGGRAHPSTEGQAA
ncbi:ABC transporter ATP-binding protein [Muricoccus radiodurans]|uniref:ABC transporter ATP-binding protein n=1 Tax=Muricoccus radiodurans TaxID=2231721 RepID=UPI003CF77F58